MAKAWRSDHPDIEFWTWPMIIDDEYPLNDVWVNMNNNIDDYTDVAAIRRCGCDLKEDFDDFHHTFSYVEFRLQKIIRNCRDYIPDSDDDID